MGRDDRPINGCNGFDQQEDLFFASEFCGGRFLSLGVFFNMNGTSHL